MKQFYITGNGFIRYTQNYWVDSIQIFESEYAIQSLLIDNFEQVSNKL